MKPKFFKFILMTLVITGCLFKTNVLAESIPVYLNNQKIELSNDVFIENGRTIVELRAICEALGYDVNWNDRNMEIEVKKTGQRLHVLFKIDDCEVRKMYFYPNHGDVLHEEKTIDIAPRIIEGRTYLPLRALVEALGDTIVWDANSRTIHVTKNPKYDRIKSYNLEDRDNDTRNYGYLPQIINPSEGERKINEKIMSRLNDKDEDRIFSEKKTSVFRNDYSYEIKNNKNNIFSILYDKTSTFHKVTEGMNYPAVNYYFYDTFYKNTGKKLEIGDILKGTEEKIGNILFEEYQKGGNLMPKNTVDRGYSPLLDFELFDYEYLIDNYDFYIEGNYLFITVDYSEDYYCLFGINIIDNAYLFQEDFLENFNN